MHEFTFSVRALHDLLFANQTPCQFFLVNNVLTVLVFSTTGTYITQLKYRA